SHRTTSQFMNMQRITQGRISVFVNQTQLVPYYSLGAAGCWSTEVWMGPWPVLHLRNLARRGENDKAAEVIADIMTASQGKPVPGEGFKRPAEYADYCKVGPTRVPFLNFPDNQIERAKKRAAHWMEMNQRYRPLVEAENGRSAA
ncbi:MAG: hypothetical protein OXE53_11775, partial [Deltaproteobacteria bacterium]|nr:hypothetical protein [Deltaproteobacteria bacterium]